MRWKSTGEAEINIGVLGSRNDVLWEFRDFLICLDAESDYKISMMLAKNQETLLRVMSFAVSYTHLDVYKRQHLFQGIQDLFYQ